MGLKMRREQEEKKKSNGEGRAGWGRRCWDRGRRRGRREAGAAASVGDVDAGPARRDSSGGAAGPLGELRLSGIAVRSVGGVAVSIAALTRLASLSGPAPVSVSRSSLS